MATNEAEGFEQWTAREVQELNRRVSELAMRVTDETQRLNRLRQLHDGIASRVIKLEKEGWPVPFTAPEEFSPPVGATQVAETLGGGVVPIKAEGIRILEQGFVRGGGPDVVSMSNQPLGYSNTTQAYNSGYIAGQRSMVEEKSGMETRILEKAAARVRAFLEERWSSRDALIADIVQQVLGKTS